MTIECSVVPWTGSWNREGMLVEKLLSKLNRVDSYQELATS